MLRHVLASALAIAASTSVAGAARGQCAARPSSCVQCHETEGRFKVRANGTTWHADHAIGDFCAGCHGGNVDSAVEADAHQGVGQPLVDPARACAPCHADTFQRLAARYASDAASRRAAPASVPSPETPPSTASSNHDLGAEAVVVTLAALAAATVAFTERRRRVARERAP